MEGNQASDDMGKSTTFNQKVARHRIKFSFVYYFSLWRFRLVPKLTTFLLNFLWLAISCYVKVCN